MKILLSLFLTVVCLDRIHCIPVYEDGRGSFTESHTSYVNGYNDTHSFNPGLKLGLQDGFVVLKSENSFGVAGKTYNDSLVTNFARPADATRSQKPTFEAPNSIQNTPMYAAPTGPLYYPQAIERIPSNGQMYRPAGGPIYGSSMGPYGPPMGGIYGPPMGGTYGPPMGGTYGPPMGGTYGPPMGGTYGPPMGGTYGPPMGGTYGPPMGGTYGPPMGGTYGPTSPIYGPNHSVYGYAPPNGQMYIPPYDQMYVPENGQINGNPTGSRQTRYPINSISGNGHPYRSTYGSYNRPNNSSYEGRNSQSFSRPIYQGQRDQSYGDESQLEHEAPQRPE